MDRISLYLHYICISYTSLSSSKIYKLSKLDEVKT